MVNTNKYISLEDIRKWNKAFDLNIKTIEVKKGDLFLEQGQRCDYLYFISKGLTRSYYYNLQGTEATHWFSSENNLTTSPDSFFRHNENIMNLEALEDTELYLISQDHINIISDNVKGFDKLFINLVIDFAMKLSDLVRSLHTESAEYRYLKLIQEYPNIFKRAKLSHIATYLGITIQSLSRLRKKLIA